MLSIFFAVFIFLFMILFVNFIIPDVDTFRTAMQCDNPSAITDGGKLTCLLGDSVVVYFICLVFSVSGGIVLDRLLI